jgi:hypothetical protein
MNAVEIEAAISDLAQAPFDAGEFPYAFLAAFGHKDTALKRLRTGNNNASDIAGGVLLRNNIHLAICSDGGVDQALKNLRESPSTVKAKAKFILATDGKTLEAEELINGETITCAFEDFPNHFGFLLPLAGISTIKEIKDNPVDIRATGRLNKLYVELLRENQDWATADRRADMNHFMARLIFCFFAEDTDIFNGQGLFTKTVEQMSERDGSNVHEVLGEIFRAMNVNTRHDGQFDNRHRLDAKLRPWADQFPYVNGGLFSGSTDVPRFTRMARTYLIHAGSLNWRQINPDIFGSMIQAVADDEERGALGMHYTSVPNILKVLNPLFLNDLREQLETAGENKAKLLNLRKRMARIRVFDPACGSGNFLVIAYKQMREIESEINRRRYESHLGSEIPVNNFRGIELRDFPAEIARLALIIAEYQCDVLYRGQKDAVAEFLPLDAQNWIICGNALRLDWLSICPPTGTGVKVVSDDLFNTPLDQTEIDFENEGGETYICGNPPYQGYSERGVQQNSDMATVLGDWGNVKRLDYIACWFKRSSEYIVQTNSKCAFVSTNSICQGEQVSLLWKNILASNLEIFFAHTSFNWRNNAKSNAGVTCVIVGICRSGAVRKLLYVNDTVKEVRNISPYLIEGSNIVMEQRSESISGLPDMALGSSGIDGGFLVLNKANHDELIRGAPESSKYIKPFVGGADIIKGIRRFCIWIEDADANDALKIPAIKDRVDLCRKYRESAGRDAKKAASVPYRFFYRKYRNQDAVVAPMTSSSRRDYLPVELLKRGTVVSNGALVGYEDTHLIFSLLSSKLHSVWLATTSARMRTDYRYSVNLTYFTFPLPQLTEQNRIDLNSCAINILLAREAHFPATIADLYEVKDGESKMPENLRLAHERNDEVLERIYIGRRFKNDTERLEKLFELYTKMTATSSKPVAKKIKKDKA